MTPASWWAMSPSSTGYPPGVTGSVVEEITGVEQLLLQMKGAI